MPKFKSFVFDQNIFTAYPKILLGSSNTLSFKMHFSSVVLYELAATTVSADDLDLYEGLRKLHDKKNTLLTPDKTDWWETAKMIRRLRFGDKSASHGLTPKLQYAAQLQNDALIARTATLAKCYVVTKDADDFRQFTPFLPNIEIIGDEEFFG
ncbi:MAG: PIN domain-containing protein [Pyrinomonadaceae bacterium]|nr:PIN domain-containing protein [Pyrinomonadaceae bacterium]